MDTSNLMFPKPKDKKQIKRLTMAIRFNNREHIAIVFINYIFILKIVHIFPNIMVYNVFIG